jgi:hypothetical protein
LKTRSLAPTVEAQRTFAIGKLQLASRFVWHRKFGGARFGTPRTPRDPANRDARHSPSISSVLVITFINVQLMRQSDRLQCLVRRLRSIASLQLIIDGQHGR